VPNTDRILPIGFIRVEIPRHRRIVSGVVGDRRRGVAGHDGPDASLLSALPAVLGRASRPPLTSERGSQAHTTGV
jgi:hypothetical protein